MHLLTVFFGPQATGVSFMFKTKENAQNALDYGKRQIVETGTCALDDDFGQHFASPSVHGFVLEDMSKSIMAGVERTLHNTRMQYRAQMEANDDPAIKAAMTRQQLANGGGGLAIPRN